MFYFVIFNSSISKSVNINKRLITTLLYGTVLYIFTHAVLSSQEKDFFKIIKQYFMFLVCIDFISTIYLYNEKCSKLQASINVFQQILDKIFGLFEDKLSLKVSEFEYDDISNTENRKDNSYNNEEDNNEEDIEEDNNNYEENKKNKSILKKHVSFSNIDENNYDTDIEDLNSPTEIRKEISETVNEIHKLNNNLLNIQLDNITNINKNNDYSSLNNGSNSTDINKIRTLTNNNQNNNISSNNNISNNNNISSNNNISNNNNISSNNNNIKELNANLLNVKMQYDPNIDTTVKSNLNLDNFQENAKINVNNNPNSVNNQFQPVTNQLKNNDVQMNFQQQMEMFNKEKNELLQKTLNKKEETQITAYSPAVSFDNNSKNNDTQSFVSNASDIGSVFDLDINDFANTIS